MFLSVHGGGSPNVGMFVGFVVPVTNAGMCVLSV